MATSTSGVALAALAAGGILVWSGVNNKKVTTVLGNLIQGKPTTPGAGLALAPVVSSGSGATGSTANLGLPANVVPSSTSEKSWITAFLTGIGAPSTTANINSVSAWIQRESVYPGNGFNTGGLYNPLNTTLGQPGATDYNSVGVKNYVSEAQGLLATIRTILGSNYNDVVAALRGGKGLCGQSFSGLSTWSGNGYSSVC